MARKTISARIQFMELFGIGIALFGTGLELLLRINPNYNSIIKKIIPEYAAVICILIGLVLIIYTIFKKGVSISKKISPALKERFDYEFVTRHDVIPNVDELFSAGNNTLHNLTHITKRIFEERFVKNNKIIRCIIRRENQKDKLSGFYLLYPITLECKELINNGLIASSIDFNIGHITSHFINASSIYISIVYAMDRHSKAFILYLIMHDIKKVLQKNKNIDSVYVRPCTDDGYRLVEKYGFKLLPLSKTIYFLRTDKLLNQDLQFAK